MWYAVQVETGKEDKTVDLVNRLADERYLKECFTPKTVMPRKVKGEWVNKVKPLFPGYVIIDSKHIDKLQDSLKKIPAFIKTLGTDEGFVSLNASEVSWISGVTDKKDHTVRVSEVYVEGDKVVVNEGPLRGLMGVVEHIDLHKRRVHLRINMFGRDLTPKLGIEIIHKPEDF